jgi:Flp pilus assembly protein TadD
MGGDSMGYYRTKLQAAYELGAAERQRAYADSLRAVLEPKVGEQPDDAALHSRLATAYAGLGRRADAVREARRGVALDPVERNGIDGAFRLVDLAYTCARVGEEDAAVDAFARLLAIPSPVAAPGLRVTPDRAIAALRRNPRFQQLLAAQP